MALSIPALPFLDSVDGLTVAVNMESWRRPERFESLRIQLRGPLAVPDASKAAATDARCSRNGRDHLISCNSDELQNVR